MDSELDRQIASREAEIERLKHLIGGGGNPDLSGGSMFSDPGERKRSGRVEALFQKLESPSQYPYQGKCYIFFEMHLTIQISMNDFKRFKSLEGVLSLNFV